MMSSPARSFELALRVEADERVPVGRGLALHSYPGPITLRGQAPAVVDKTLGQIARSAAPGSGMVEITAGVVRSADRLQVVWADGAPVAFTAARHVRVAGLTGWYVTLSCVEPDAAGRGLFSTTLRRLLIERPGSFVACTTDSPAVRRAFRRLSPSRTLFPEEGRPPPANVLAVARELLRTTFGSAAADCLGDDLVRRDVAGPANSGRWAQSGEGALIIADVDGRLHRTATATDPHRPAVVGVTGTNGKTSVVEYGRQLSSQLGRPGASFGTLGVVSEIGRTPRPRIGGGPGAVPLLAERLWKLGVDLLWFEAFSYSLAEGLIDRTEVDVAVLTQIDLDHVGVHRTPAAYRAAKLRLFERCLRADGTAVYDPSAQGATAVEAVCRRRGVATVRLGPAGDVDLRIDPRDTGGTLRVGTAEHRVGALPAADYQRANLLAALGAAFATGAEPSALAKAVTGLRGPPGRLEYVETDLDHDVVVDAAHNGSGLEATLRHLRTTTDGRLLTLIASVGNADRNRWESLGEAASVLADEVVVTDESPYGRDPAVVRAGLLAGCPQAREIPDRPAAIGWLLDRARPGDTVLLAGRADEDFVVTRSGRVPFPTDAELVRVEAARR